MSPIEKAARALSQELDAAGQPVGADDTQWTAQIPRLLAVIDALREPSRSMKEAGSEVIRHVGDEESDEGYQSDAANVWRFMIDMLHRDAARIRSD